MSTLPPRLSRLQGLPRRVQLPLRELLAAGQLSEEVLDVVLDGVDLAGAPSKALAFAVAFLYLQERAVPVRDVIQMARAQGRRIRLEWSASRWRLEHDRLSRVEALKRLATENVRYDLQDVRRLLPAHFAGYLIGTSRRLGMEGLRQRHCVAGYHASIRAGYFVIASVFVDHRRWTVQIARTGRVETPLRIMHIATRFNDPPGKEIEERIHRMLRIQRDVRIATHSDGPGAPPPVHMYMENLQRLLPVLRARGVHKVTVEFDGSGDSGSIQEIDYGTSLQSEAIVVDVAVLERGFDGRQWTSATTLQPLTLDRAIEALTDDYLEETGVDWYNNDGGWGSLVILVDDGLVSLSVQVREIESVTRFESCRRIETGEEVDS